MKKQLFIITGLSGAGKSQALNILEDLGFYCVDNFPVPLISQFVDVYMKTNSARDIALGIDIRAGKALGQLHDIIAYIRKKKINCKVIFFSANDSTLIKRFSETRRKHPLGKNITGSIARERTMMETTRALADKEIDTSRLTTGELKEIIARVMKVNTAKQIAISAISFGYKYGIPAEADIIMDVRFLPNPNYIHSLRSKTGKDSGVRKYVHGQKLYKEFLSRYLKMILFLLPNYIKEGKSHLSVAIGCTGGRHRSVVCTEDTSAQLSKRGFAVTVLHRDIERGIY